MMKKWPQEKWADPVKQNNISYMGKEYKSYIDLADKLKKISVDTVYFDRGGNLYHGRVQALAEGVREAGLNF